MMSATEFAQTLTVPSTYTRQLVTDLPAETSTNPEKSSFRQCQMANIAVATAGYVRRQITGLQYWKLKCQNCRGERYSCRFI